MQRAFIGVDPRLEAVFEGEGQRRAVITHPHPLYGGTMDNNVVLAARDAALSAGFATLRFNFRGVGRSSGVHDDGRGEVHDLETALAEAGERPVLIGYSFGAWVCASLLRQQSLPCILISPPTGMFAFPAMQDAPVQAVVGSHDQFCDRQALQASLDDGSLTIIPGIDHFWFGREQVLRDFLAPILRQWSLMVS